MISLSFSIFFFTIQNFYENYKMSNNDNNNKTAAIVVMLASVQLGLAFFFFLSFLLLFAWLDFWDFLDAPFDRYSAFFFRWLAGNHWWWWWWKKWALIFYFFKIFLSSRFLLAATHTHIFTHNKVVFKSFFFWLFLISKNFFTVRTKKKFGKKDFTHTRQIPFLNSSSSSSIGHRRIICLFPELW